MAQAAKHINLTEAVVSRLDELIALLEQRTSEPVDLLLEHLHSARTYWLGAMPKEFTVALSDARAAARQLGADRRQVLGQALDYLHGEVEQLYPPQETSHWHHSHPKPPASPPEGTGSHLWNFFGQEPISMGVFYPKHHIIAAFPSFHQAKEAGGALHQAGFSEEEAVAISSEEMLLFLDEVHLRPSVWGSIMTGLSRVFGTEQVFVEKDIRMAREGAGFAAIYSPVESEKDRIRLLLAPFNPLSMQLYLASGIESLI
jgi:hypothetical protein